MIEPIATQPHPGQRPPPTGFRRHRTICAHPHLTQAKENIYHIDITF
jgi:hypothetical protein